MRGAPRPGAPTPRADRPEDPRAIVGLGNPGPGYEGTRHNVGYEVVRRIIRAHAPPGKGRRIWHARVRECRLGPTPLMLILPRTFMNLSGRTVRACRDAGGLPPHRILIVCDDLNLPLASIRIRRRGSSGGHKGLGSIIDHLGTEAFPRIRVGIGAPGDREAETFVLEPFAAEEREAMEEAFERAAEAAATWVAEGVEEAMQRFNG